MSEPLAPEGPDLIRSARFRAEREPSWTRLTGLLDKADRVGMSRLSFEEAHDLTALYRQAVNSLSVAREVTLDRALLSYLEALCARAYLTVYAPQATVAGVVGRFFRQGAPRAIRRSWLPIGISALLMAFGAVVAYLLVRDDASWYYAFVPEGLSGGRGPGASEQALRDVIYDANPSSHGLAAFATYLFSHNTQVAIFCFALGIVGCLLTGFLLFYNGTILGAFFAVHEEKGLAFDLFGWLSIHGVTELSAIIIAAAGGLVLGLAVLFPGQATRAEALRRAGRDAVHLVVVAALMLFAAGILEGFFRQLVQDIWWRLGIGWGIGALWLAWFLLAGRRGGAGNTREAGSAREVGSARKGGNTREAGNARKAGNAREGAAT